MLEVLTYLLSAYFSDQSFLLPLTLAENSAMISPLNLVIWTLLGLNLLIWNVVFSFSIPKKLEAFIQTSLFTANALVSKAISFDMFERFKEDPEGKLSYD